MSKRALTVLGASLFIVFTVMATIVLKSDSKEVARQGVDRSELTKEEVSKRNTASDCWTIINNKVYDITRYISSHPGGGEILRACGTDASTMFNDRQTEEGQSIGPGTPHSSRARSQLEQYLVGELSQ